MAAFRAESLQGVFPSWNERLVKAFPKFPLWTFFRPVQSDCIQALVTQEGLSLLSWTVISTMQTL